MVRTVPRTLSERMCSARLRTPSGGAFDPTLKLVMIMMWAERQIRDSIVVSISARHAEDPGSIPGRGVLCRCRANRARANAMPISTSGFRGHGATAADAGCVARRSRPAQFLAWLGGAQARPRRPPSACGYAPCWRSLASATQRKALQGRGIFIGAWPCPPSPRPALPRTPVPDNGARSTQCGPARGPRHATAQTP